MTIEDSIFQAMKTAAWERAKGELRALVAIKGSVRTEPVPPPGEPLPFEALRDRVEAFIRDVEDDGLQE